MAEGVHETGRLLHSDSSGVEVTENSSAVSGLLVCREGRGGGGGAAVSRAGGGLWMVMACIEWLRVLEGQGGTVVLQGPPRDLAWRQDYPNTV